MKIRQVFNRLFFIPLSVFVAGTAVGSGAEQLVSKSTGLILPVGEYIWVFDKNNLNFSRINFFADPIRISNTHRKESKALTGGVAVKSGVLGHSITHRGDNIWEIGFHHVQEKKDNDLFSFRFKINIGLLQDFQSASGDTLAGVHSAIVGTDILESDSLFIFGLKTGGIAFLPKDENTGLPLFKSDIRIHLLTGKGYLIDTLTCPSDTSLCSLQPFEDVQPLGGILSADHMALLERDGEPGYLFVGSAFEGKGLRRGKLGSDTLAPVKSAGLDTLRISDIYIHPADNSVWVFTEKRLYLSLDSGASFFEPVKPYKIHSDIVSNLQSPSLAFKGDSSYINFDFPNRPGLVLFRGDSLFTNKDVGKSEYKHYLIPGLDLPEDALLGQMAAAAQDGRTVLTVGTQTRGIYYTLFEDDKWLQINRQLGLEDKLKEVITFPTIFDGTEDVQFGYRLKKTGKVTIRVFNYAMEPVKTLVRNQKRRGGGSRSENPAEDKWDGTDKFGQNVSTGVYYIQIKSDNGERGWGKVIVVGGQE